MAVLLRLASPDEIHRVRRENPFVTFELVPDADLRHIEPTTQDARAKRLLKTWDIGKLRPLRLAPGDDGKLTLLDGDHRLRTMRALGFRRIPAFVTRGRA